MSENMTHHCGHLKKRLQAFYHNTDDTLLLVIDVQDKLSKAMFNEDLVKKNTKILVQAARILEIPTVFTEQYPKGLGNTNQEIFAEAKEPTVIEKVSFAAYDGELKEKLAELGKKHIIVAGIEAHICVMQTVLDLMMDGYEVTVVGDAAGSRSKENYKNGLEMMKDMKAVISNTEAVLFSLLKTSKHQNFKEVQALIK